MAALSLLGEKNVLESYLLTLQPVGSFPLFPARSQAHQLALEGRKLQ